MYEKIVGRERGSQSRQGNVIYCSGHYKCVGKCIKYVHK